MSASEGKMDEVNRHPSLLHHLLCCIHSPSDVMLRMNNSGMEENGD